MVGLKINV